LAVESEGGAIRLVEADSGAEIARLEGPVHTCVLPACFSPDGTHLVAGDIETERLVVWDLRALRQDLQALGLDWHAQPFPPAAGGGPLRRLSVEVRLGNFRQQAKADQLVAQARRDLLSRQPAAAVAALRDAVRASPSHGEAHNFLAWLLLTGPKPLRNPEEALPLARKALELAPRDPRYLNTLGVALYRAGKPAEAVVRLEKSLATRQGKTAAFDLFFLAMCHAQLGDKEKAKDCFARAVESVEGQKGMPATQAEELKAFRREAEEKLGQE
jgi:Tfp pilus assembly protein PilF